MPRFLVPVDFSTVSVNAALYAVQMAEKMPIKEVVLYNVTEKTEIDLDESSKQTPISEFLANNLRSLENLQVSLFEMGLSPMEIVAEIGELPERIKPVIEKQKIDMVVMGITGHSSYGDSVFGKNALTIAKANTCPVMIVPPDAFFKGSKKIAMAVELKDVNKTVAIGPIKKWLDVLMPELHFVYVGASSENDLTEEQKSEKAKLEEIFKDYKSVFNFLPQQNFSEGINTFIEENAIDQIVVFPKKHGVFESLFAGNHAKKLAYHSHIPVLTIHA